MFSAVGRLQTGNSQKPFRSGTGGASGCFDVQTYSKMYGRTPVTV